MFEFLLAFWLQFLQNTQHFGNSLLQVHAFKQQPKFLGFYLHNLLQIHLNSLPMPIFWVIHIIDQLPYALILQALIKLKPNLFIWKQLEPCDDFICPGLGLQDVYEGLWPDERKLAEEFLRGGGDGEFYWGMGYCRAGSFEGFGLAGLQQWGRLGQVRGRGLPWG
jgi:hypothetical protein